MAAAAVASAMTVRASRIDAHPMCKWTTELGVMPGQCRCERSDLTRASNKQTELLLTSMVALVIPRF
jgi:hypothetical protein